MTTMRPGGSAGQAQQDGRALDGRLSDERPSSTAVPRVLRDLAAWSWRLLLVAAAFYVVWIVLSQVSLLVLALLGALFFAALLEPLQNLLGHVLPRVLASFLTVILLLAGIGLLGWFVVRRGAADASSVIDDANGVVTQLGDAVKRLPGSPNVDVERIQNDVLNYLNDNRSSLALSAVSGARTLVEVLAGAVLGIFFLIYFLYDGAGIWRFLVGLAPQQRRLRVNEAGHRAWRRVGGFVRGTTVIALFHGIFVGGLLLLLDVPLAVPLALLIFVGSFIPIVGAFAFGGLALLVVVLTQGFGPGLLFLAVLVVDNQIEAHVLQPFLVGRYVRLHPVAVAVALTAGGLVAGIPGAIFAVPLVSAADGAFRVLRSEPGSRKVHAEPADDGAQPAEQGG